MLRTEIGRIKPLEEKVNSLDSAVNQIQGSLRSLDSGQQTTNNKLDNLALLIQKFLPKTKGEEIKIDEPDPRGQKKAKPQPNKTNKQDPPSPPKRTTNGNNSKLTK